MKSFIQLITKPYFALLLGLSFYFVSTNSYERTEFLFTYTTYYFLIFIIFLISFLLFRDIKQSSWSLKKNPENMFFLVTSIIFALFIFIFVGADLRILADESNLVSTSYSFYKLQQAAIVNGFYFKDGEPIFTTLAKPARHPLYAFLTSLVHTLSGYRLANAYFVNFLCSVLTFFCFQKLIAKYSDKWMAVISVLLLVSTPLVPLYIASAGFDFLNVTLITLLLFCLAQHLENSNPKWIKWSLIVSFLAVYNRYESVFAVSLVLFTAFLMQRKEFWKFLKTQSGKILYFSWLFFPIVWQRIMYLMFNSSYHSGYYGSYKDKPTEAFSLHYILPNLKSLRDAFFIPEKTMFFNSLIAILFVVAIFVLLLNLKKITWNNKTKLLSLAAIYTFGQLLVLLVFISGEAHHVSQSRLFLPFVFFISAFSLFPFLKIKNIKWQHFSFACVSIFSFALFAHKTFNKDLYKRYDQLNEYHFITHDSPVKFHQDDLLLAIIASNYTINMIPTIYPKTAWENWKKIHSMYKNGEFKNIYYFKRVRNEDFYAQNFQTRLKGVTPEIIDYVKSSRFFYTVLFRLKLK